MYSSTIIQTACVVLVGMVGFSDAFAPAPAEADPGPTGFLAAAVPGPLVPEPDSPGDLTAADAFLPAPGVPDASPLAPYYRRRHDPTAQYLRVLPQQSSRLHAAGTSPGSTASAAEDDDDMGSTAATDGKRSTGDRRPVALLYKAPWPYVLGAGTALMTLLLGCVLLVAHRRRRRYAPVAAMYAHIAQSTGESSRAGRRAASVSPPQDRRRAA